MILHPICIGLYVAMVVCWGCLPRIRKRFEWAPKTSLPIGNTTGYLSHTSHRNNVVTGKNPIWQLLERTSTVLIVGYVTSARPPTSRSLLVGKSKQRFKSKERFFTSTNWFKYQTT
jgi:hypothetical protein